MQDLGSAAEELGKNGKGCLWMRAGNAQSGEGANVRLSIGNDPMQYPASRLFSIQTDLLSSALIEVRD